MTTETRRDVFQAIADPTRRKIIDLISNQPMNLKTIADFFNISRPAISQQIKILNECVTGNSAGGSVRVVIGRENVASSMKRCSVITTSYLVGGDVSGTLGVVGPMRIEYGRLMAVVNYLARFIERALLNEASLQ